MSCKKTKKTRKDPWNWPYFLGTAKGRCFICNREIYPMEFCQLLNGIACPLCFEEHKDLEGKMQIGSKVKCIGIPRWENKIGIVTKTETTEKGRYITVRFESSSYGALKGPLTCLHEQHVEVIDE